MLPLALTLVPSEGQLSTLEALLAVLHLFWEWSSAPCLSDDWSVAIVEVDELVGALLVRRPKVDNRRVRLLELPLPSGTPRKELRLDRAALRRCRSAAAHLSRFC